MVRTKRLCELFPKPVVSGSHQQHTHSTHTQVFSAVDTHKKHSQRHTEKYAHTPGANQGQTHTHTNFLNQYRVMARLFSFIITEK